MQLFVDFSEVRAFIALDDSDAAHFNVFRDVATHVERGIQYGALSRLFRRQPVLLPPHHLELVNFITALSSILRTLTNRLDPALHRDEAVASLEVAISKPKKDIEKTLRKYAPDFLWLLNKGWSDSPQERLHQLLVKFNIAAYSKVVEELSLPRPDIHAANEMATLIDSRRSQSDPAAARRDANALELLHRLRQKKALSGAWLVSRSDTMIRAAHEGILRWRKGEVPVVHSRAFALAAIAIEVDNVDALDRKEAYVDAVRGAVDVISARHHDPSVNQEWLLSIEDEVRNSWTKFFELSSVQQEYQAARSHRERHTLPSKKKKTGDNSKYEAVFNSMMNYLETHSDDLVSLVDGLRWEALSPSASVVSRKTLERTTGGTRLSIQGIPYPIRFRAKGAGYDVYCRARDAKGGILRLLNEATELVQSDRPHTSEKSGPINDERYERYLAAAYVAARVGQWQEAGLYAKHAIAGYPYNYIVEVAEAELIVALTERKSYALNALDGAASTLRSLLKQDVRNPYRFHFELAANLLTQAEVALDGGAAREDASVESAVVEALQHLAEAEALIPDESRTRVWLHNARIYVAAVGLGDTAKTLSTALQKFETWAKAKFHDATLTDILSKEVPPAVVDSFVWGHFRLGSSKSPPSYQYDLEQLLDWLSEAVVASALSDAEQKKVRGHIDEIKFALEAELSRHSM
ncbi:MAG: hypothetical protein IH855_04825 [Bacteroidetes bacterium]|nr:hypothetical protein [Bacteroidota bacterium]